VLPARREKREYARIRPPSNAAGSAQQQPNRASYFAADPKSHHTQQTSAGRLAGQLAARKLSGPVDHDYDHGAQVTLPARFPTQEPPRGPGGPVEKFSPGALFAHY
jgi:hypothetical protein